MQVAFPLIYLLIIEHLLDLKCLFLILLSWILPTYRDHFLRKKEQFPDLACLSIRNQLVEQTSRLDSFVLDSLQDSIWEIQLLKRQVKVIEFSAVGLHWFILFVCAQNQVKWVFIAAFHVFRKRNFFDFEGRISLWDWNFFEWAFVLTEEDFNVFSSLLSLLH